MNRTDLIVVGAGPAGMSAAIEAAKRGVSVVTVFDENARPGGQLFKQIHKFFGSKEHRAKVRGFVIGEELIDEAAQSSASRSELDSTVIGLYQDKEVVVRKGEEVNHYKADAIVVATGAAENMVTFEGWTLPGVIGAGAAQTMMNLHGVKPGERVLMLGTGNVGLVVSTSSSRPAATWWRSSTLRPASAATACMRRRSPAQASRSTSPHRSSAPRAPTT
jgi:NADPH-dependent 2,4-dienoyl-CoA reductase/sulfur reductase-like enzyme